MSNGFFPSRTRLASTIDAFRLPVRFLFMLPSRFVTSSTAESLSPYFAGKPPDIKFTSETASGLNILITP